MTTIAIDFETANYPRESAIAIGISVIDEETRTVTETRDWFFKPPGNRIYIRRDFIDIHGITPAMLKDKPYFDGHWPEMESYFKNADTIIAHNAGFDRGVLAAVTAHYGIKLPHFVWRCTVNLSRRTWPGLINHKLSTVAAHLDIPLNHHDAASDAHACANIYLQATAPEAATG